jgi:CDGSH-type Zn-finger protein
MMEPVIAGQRSIKINVAKDKAYFWCACGRSKQQPFCDGSHSGTDFTPVKFIAEEDGIVYLCACKHTSKQPFCDGSHRSLNENENS